MADTVAIISVVSSATVAVTVPFINALLERTRFRWQSGEVTVAEFRALLDSTLLLMHKAFALHAEALDTIGNARDEPALPDEVSKQLREVREAFSSTADELYRDGLRLSLRLAVEAPVVKAHQDAVSYFQAAAGELALFVVDKERERAGKGSGLSQSYRFSETHDRLGESMRAFMDAARTYVAPVQLTPAPVH
jgi:hypothetical protein